MLQGSVVTADGKIYTFENSRNFHEVHATDESKGPDLNTSGLQTPQAAAPAPKPVSPQSPEPAAGSSGDPAPQEEITQEFLARKYGSNLKAVGQIDPTTLKKMRALIPLAATGDLPPIRIEGDDIVSHDYWAYFPDPQDHSWKKVLIGLTVVSQTRVRNNPAAKTLFTFLQDNVLNK